MKTLAALAVLLLPPAALAADLAGTVVETMDAAGYTYLLLKTEAGEKKWAAVPKAKVKKGAKAVVVNYAEMRGFQSPTLNRSFDVIAFGTFGDGSAPAAAPAPERAADRGPIKVARAAGADARSIAELHAQKKSLSGKEVVVSGEVVKYSAGILGANWAHLRDGTGKAKDGSDDVTVILKEDAEMGQVITVRGKVVIDKDLGGMYKFPVALEDASLVGR